MIDFTRLTATELSALYRSGAASPVAVAKQVLAKIELLNPVLNAFCFTDPDTTLKQAQDSEHRWQQKQPLSELDGVPVAFKDSLLTQGWPTLHGSLAIDPNQPWLEDAPAVARLREAGAIFVGKTTMPEFSVGTKSTMSQIYGVTVNPWNIKCSSGGSSGGSAVTVAADLVPIAIGTDLGGSTTVPGSFCGVFGYKPSAAKVAHSPRDALNLGTASVFARSVNDLITTINVISTPDARDWFYIPSTKIPAGNDFQHEFLKVGWLVSTQDADMQLILNKIQDLWQPCPVDILKQFDLHLALEIFVNIGWSILLDRWKNLTQEQQLVTEKHTQKLAIISKDLHNKFDLYYWLNQRFNFSASLNHYINKFDVIVVPATNTSAANVPCDVKPDNSDINFSLWSIICTVAGWPSVTVPVGIDAYGLPLAVMVIGPQCSDAQVLRAASELQTLFPMPPCPVIL